jgi:hypothetical protein
MTASDELDPAEDVVLDGICQELHKRLDNMMSLWEQIKTSSSHTVGETFSVQSASSTCSNQAIYHPRLLASFPDLPTDMTNSLKTKHEIQVGKLQAIHQSFEAIIQGLALIKAEFQGKLKMSLKGC